MARTFITREFFPVNSQGFNNTFVSVFYDDVANTVIAFGLGKIICVQDYDGSGDAGTFQKVSTSNGTFADWIVIATENKASTGAIGSSPI